MELNLKESIDFNFFDEQQLEHQSENITPSSLKTSALKPPVHPSLAKPLPKTDIAVNNNYDKFSGRSRQSWSSSDSDISRDSSPENLSVSSSESKKKRKSSSSRNTAKVEPQSSCSSSLSTSSSRSSLSSSPSLIKKSNNYYDNHMKSKDSDTEKTNISHSSSSSDSEGRPTNPLAKSEKKTFQKRNKQKKIEPAVCKYLDSESRPTNPLAKPEKQTFQKRYRQEKEVSDYSDSDNKKIKNTIICDDNGDYKRDSKNIKHGWEELNETKEQERRSKSNKTSGALSKDRPKTAVKNKNKNAPRSHSASGTLSDSDITDVSSIDTPRKTAPVKLHSKNLHSKMSSAGDGHPVKIRFKSVSEAGKGDDTIDQDNDPDKITGFDLKILMRAVGELEKQKRVQTNSRQVMFNPATLRSAEKSNYTFDKKQTRDIERENHRLLKEIVRQVSSEEKKKQFCRPSNFYRLTPSAVNRERDIQRIERENLAFLKRLQAVKPTKSISRDQQLKAYENTVYHGVPIAAIHQRPNRRHTYDYAIDESDISSEGRTRSVTSVASNGSSIHSGVSSRSSRPSSASRKSGFSTKHIPDSRPAWSDRW